MIYTVSKIGRLVFSCVYKEILYWYRAVGSPPNRYLMMINAMQNRKYGTKILTMILIRLLSDFYETMPTTRSRFL
jgi:hypothetical protein